MAKCRIRATLLERFWAADRLVQVRGVYALLEIFRVAGGANDSGGVFAGAGGRWNWSQRWAGLLRRTSGLQLRLLRLLSVCMCALWLLWAELVRKRTLHWSRAVVSRILGPSRLGPRLCRPFRLLGSWVCWPWLRRTWLFRPGLCGTRLR